MIVDLRSDTLTKPTPEMLETMIQAEVGDDVFNEDPTVKQLEETTSSLFGKEAGLYCPSGTMTNQIAIKVSTQPQQEVICDRVSHVYNYEGGGIAFNSLASVRLVDGDRGRFTPEDVLDNINPDNEHFTTTALVALENTVNKGGGCYYSLSQMQEVAKTSREHGLALHLDGARLFNALVETGDGPEDVGACFDTISICLSKGLGAPVGSVLLGSHESIKKARRVRKVFGGGMRQAGYMAAAGLYALENHRDRLIEDHSRAKTLGEIFSKKPYVTNVLPVDTNILIFKLAPEVPPKTLLDTLEQKGIKAIGFGPSEIRMVTHLDITDAMIGYVDEVTGQLKL